MPAAGGDSRTAPVGTAVAVPRAVTQSLGKLKSVQPWALPAQLAGLHPRETHTQTTRERSSDVRGSLVGDEASHVLSGMEEGTREIGRKHTGRAGQLVGRQAGRTHSSIEGS